MIFSAFAAAATAQQAQPVKAAEDDPVVCTRRRGTSTVGTHMRSKRICMRKSEWDYVEKHTQRELRQVRDQQSKDPGLALGGRPGE